MANIVDFQKIVEDYARKIAEEHNTRFTWVSLDGSRHDQPSRKLSYSLGRPRFEWREPLATYDLMFGQTLQNTGRETITTRIDWAEKTKDVWKQSTTTGLKIGAAIEKTLGIPKISSSRKSINIEVNFSHTSAREWEEERSWSINQEVPQSPKTTTTLEWFLDKSSAECSFRVNIAISGAAAIWFRDRIAWFDGTNRHHLWFPSPGQIVREMQRAGHALPGFEADGFRANFRATGTVQADVGIHSRLRITEAPPQSTHAGTQRRGRAVALSASRGAVAADASTKTVEYVLNPAGKVLRKQPVGANK